MGENALPVLCLASSPSCYSSITNSASLFALLHMGCYCHGNGETALTKWFSVNRFWRESKQTLPGVFRNVSDKADVSFTGVKTVFSEIQKFPLGCFSSDKMRQSILHSISFLLGHWRTLLISLGDRCIHICTYKREHTGMRAEKFLSRERTVEFGFLPSRSLRFWFGSPESFQLSSHCQLTCLIVSWNVIALAITLSYFRWIEVMI